MEERRENEERRTEDRKREEERKTEEWIQNEKEKTTEREGKDEETEERQRKEDSEKQVIGGERHTDQKGRVPRRAPDQRGQGTKPVPLGPQGQRVRCLR